jgi:hypothetical protein
VPLIDVDERVGLRVKSRSPNKHKYEEHAHGDACRSSSSHFKVYSGCSRVLLFNPSYFCPLLISKSSGCPRVSTLSILVVQLCYISKVYPTTAQTCPRLLARRFLPRPNPLHLEIGSILCIPTYFQAVATYLREPESSPSDLG